MFNSIHVKRIILGAKIILIKFNFKKYRGHISVIIVSISKIQRLHDVAYITKVLDY